MSSLYNQKYAGINAIRNTGVFCHTKKGVGQWWKGMFRHEYTISKVVIQNRRDCCGQRLA